jgi:hypothetical protein
MENLKKSKTYQILGWQGIALVGFILFLILIYLEKWKDGEGLFNSFWELIDPVSAISTFAFTLFILWNQARNKWEDKLEKRLYVDYVYFDNDDQEETLFKVEGAYLPGESDIRSWSQQLGSQLANNHQLKFDMKFKENPSKIQYDIAEMRHYKKYEIEMYLRINPITSSLKEHYEQNLKGLPGLGKFSEIMYDELSDTIIWRRKSVSES